MPKFVTTVKTTPGQTISGYDFGYSQPEYFRDWVNGNWRKERPGAILDCEALPRTAEAWQELGAFLTRELVSMGRSVGVYIDCGQPLPPLQSWLRTAAARVGGEVDPEWGTGPGCGYVVQDSYGADWLPTLWHDTDSNWFHFGIGLMVVSFDTRQSEELRFDEVNGERIMNTFGNLLKSATGWLVPWDGNIGFQLGLPDPSDLYRRLTFSDSTGPAA